MWFMGLHLIAASSQNSLAKINFKHVFSCLQFIRKECIREPTALFPAPTNILTASPHSHQPVQGPPPAAGGIRALPAAGASFVEGSLSSLERLSLHSLGPPLQKLLTHREQVPSPACRHAPSPGLSCPGVGIRDPACSFPSLCCEHAGTEGGGGGRAEHVVTCTLTSTCILVYPKGQFPMWSPQMQSRGHAGTRSVRDNCVCLCASARRPVKCFT